MERAASRKKFELELEESIHTAKIERAAFRVAANMKLAQFNDAARERIKELEHQGELKHQAWIDRKATNTPEDFNTGGGDVQ